MKRDIPQLMQEKGIDAIVVSMNEIQNPIWSYLTNCEPLTHGHFIWKRGEEPVLIHAGMERDQAVATGYRTRPLSVFDLREITDVETDPLQVSIKMRRRILERSGVTGRVAFYGTADVSQIYHVLKAIDGMDGLTIVEDFSPSIFDRARITKDEDEAEAVRRSGVPVYEALRRVVDFCKNLRRNGETLTTADGKTPTIGDLKRIITSTLQDAGYQEDRGHSIVSQGRDAGVPHNIGNPGDPLRAGKTIIIDIFPAPMAGGYFFDVTRTFTIGYADEEVQKLYDDVKASLDFCMGNLELGKPTRQLQVDVCKFFESRGHPTVGSDPKIESGYVHGLGHGVGLQVHERPSFADSAANTDILEAGHVVTIEPGLYYPERGMGIRLEEIVYIRPDGTPDVLSTFPLDMVIPCQEG